MRRSCQPYSLDGSSDAAVNCSNVFLSHTPVKRPFVQDYPGEPVPERKTNLDFTGARDSEWQWHPLGHMQVCTSLQSDNHASTPPLSFLEAGCPSCRPTNSVKALKATCFYRWQQINEVRQETVRQWAAAVAVRRTRARQHQCWQCEAEPQRVADVGS